jgi:ParB family chromosome partitioning protein
MTKPKLAIIDELLFATQEERDDLQREKVYDAPLTEIDQFPEHPFQVRDDEEMSLLVESIKEHGVLSPALARKKTDGRFELISGHRRKRACELAGLEKMPLIVRELTGDQAAIIMCDSNLQREDVLPSEKAHAYKMKLDALKRQGKRSDMTSRPVVDKFAKSADMLGAATGESGRQVQRYIRLTALVPQLLQMVDESKVAFRPAVELSYLPAKEQRAVLGAMQREQCTPSLAQALKMKQFLLEGSLTNEIIASIMQETKPNQKERLHIPREQIAKYFKKDASAEDICRIIVKALELLSKQEKNRASRDVR